jgi:hypothetical protein
MQFYILLDDRRPVLDLSTTTGVLTGNWLLRVGTESLKARDRGIETLKGTLDSRADSLILVGNGLRNLVTQSLKVIGHLIGSRVQSCNERSSIVSHLLPHLSEFRQHLHTETVNGIR